MLSRVAGLRADVGGTPIGTVLADCRGRTHRMILKYESFNPTGSVKDRTAFGLLAAMEQNKPFTPGTVVVESTSGNLGLGLARLLSLIDCRFIAVIDPETPAPTRRMLTDAGAELRCVEEPDGLGGYLLTRLRTVRELCAANRNYRWTDQYSNPANPWIHEVTTGPEIARQADAEMDAFYAAVSTGGTLAGISSHLRRLVRPIRIVAVDSEASRVTRPVGQRRLLSGIGASRPSSFLRADSYDAAVQIGDAEAIAMCRIFFADTGIKLGGSSGAVVRACLADLAGPNAPRLPLCLCPDGGDRYTGTVYDDAWLVHTNLAAPVGQAVDRLRADGVVFRIG